MGNDVAAAMSDALENNAVAHASNPKFTRLVLELIRYHGIDVRPITSNLGWEAFANFTCFLVLRIRICAGKGFTNKQQCSKESCPGCTEENEINIMKNILSRIVMLFVAFIFLVAVRRASPSFVEHVRLSIGTGGEGFGVGGLMPGVQLPFGQIRASPDTKGDINLAWNHYGGYYYNDHLIKCFSHTHMVGSGATDYGNVCLMPLSKIDSKRVDVQSKFHHDNETMEPGFYSVYLDDSRANVEVTAAGEHVVVYRFTFGEGRSLSIDPTSSLVSDACVGAQIEIVPDKRTLVGWGRTKGSLTGRNGKGVAVYFALRAKADFSAWGVWVNETPLLNETRATGNDIRAFVSVSERQVEVAFGISFVSVEQALINVQSEWNSQTSFDEYKDYAQNTWERHLSLIDIQTDDDDDTLVKFYTALYHAFMAPTLFSDANGKYLDMTGNVQTLPNGTKHYTDMSIWDIHRTQVPLLSLVRPQTATEIAQSLVRMYKDGGDLPRWPIANVYSGCMIGNHANVILLDVLRKIGGSAFDVQAAYDAMKVQAEDPRRPHIGRAGLDDYLRYGYVGRETSSESVSLTLAYAFDDWAIGQVAVYLGLSADAARYANRSKSYKNVWDSKRKLMCPRDVNGTFHCPLDPNLNDWIVKNSGYTEGNAAQWTWFVPHDVPGLIDLFGENDFVSRLDQFMERSERQKSNLLPNSYYWAGNEPDLLSPYLFNFAKRANLTQRYVRWLADNRYTTEPRGVPGNDDYGTLSSWYVWSVIGLYPLAGTTLYFVGAPRARDITISLTNGARLKIFVNASSIAGDSYVTSAWVNGKPVDMIDHPFVDHAEISKGGNITFWMTSM